MPLPANARKSEPPPIRWKAFSLPKRGHTTAEYEDAFAGSPENGRFAVADGASESSFAGLWAKLLVEGFVHPGPRTDGEKNWLELPQKRWAADVDPRSLAWFAEEKRAQGAFATFLGVSITRSEKSSGGRWRALAVGDSCLFHISKDQLVKSFPATSAGEFGNQPDLLCSRPMSDEVLARRQKLERGKWHAGDRFFLMTDALAHWFLCRHKAAGKPWQVLAQKLAAPAPDAALTALIDELRAKEGMRNDDVTLLTIDV